MEIIIIFVQAILVFMAFTILYYTLVQFVVPSFNKKGQTYILQSAHNISVNNSEDNPHFAMAGESTDGWGTSHMEIDNKANKESLFTRFMKLFNPSKTRVNTFGPQSRPHGYGLKPSA